MTDHQHSVVRCLDSLTGALTEQHPAVLKKASFLFLEPSSMVLKSSFVAVGRRSLSPDHGKVCRPSWGFTINAAGGWNEGCQIASHSKIRRSISEAHRLLGFGGANNSLKINRLPTEWPNRSVKRSTNFVNTICKGKLSSRSGLWPDRLARLPSR